MLLLQAADTKQQQQQSQRGQRYYYADRENQAPGALGLNVFHFYGW